MIPLDSVAALRRISVETCEEVFTPPPIQTVSEHADENRVLPNTSAEPGRFRTDRIPYLRWIQDQLGDDRIREFIFAKSAQVAGSTAGENWIGYLIDQAPCAILSVWPTEKKLKWWSTKRLRPMIEESACLAQKFPRSGRRDSKDSIASKEFPGGYLQLLTAKSTADLRSADARVAIAEEVDEWEGDVGDQGDPLELLRTRMRTFWNSKLYIVSTPTLEGYSRVWKELEGSTFHEVWVPCPACQTYQRLVWQDETGAYRIIFERDAGGEVIPGTARYLCIDCGTLIPESEKAGMLERGEWRPRNPGRFTVGAHINTLYSPLCSWDDVARAFLRSQHSPAKMQVFVNNWLGLPYRAEGEQVEAHFLKSRVETYPKGPVVAKDIEPVDLVPRGVGILSAGVDVQGDRLELFTWGWGHLEESWFQEWVRLDGDPGRDEVWQELDRELLRPRIHQDGAQIRIAAVAIDAGYQTERVARFCELRAGRRVIATVGREGRGRPLLQAPGAERMKRGPKRKRPMYVVGIDSGKDMLNSRLKLTLRDDGSAPPEYVHFPDTVDPVFFDQLTAERLITGYVRKRPVRIWKLIEGRRNEALDGAVLAMAALQHLGGAVIRRLGEFSRELSARGGASQAAQPAAAPARRMRSRGVDW
jgi:phage terminase large subunit GpA-like protein